MNSLSTRIPPARLAVLVLALIALVLLAACSPAPAAPAATQAQPAAAAGWQEISVSQAAEKRDSGAFMLDVRQPEEWNELHIPEATLIPLGELSTRLSEVPKDQEIVVYCRSGNRSKEGADILTKAGFTNVVSMAGGINQWSAAGYPTVTGP